MKKTNLILGTAIALCSVSAYAQSLMVGFEQSGVANSLTVDLGGLSTIVSNSSGSLVGVDHDFGIISGISADFGSVTSNLQWSAFGTIGAGGGSVAGVSLLPDAVWFTQNGGVPTTLGFSQAGSVTNTITTLGFALGTKSVGDTQSYGYNMNPANPIVPNLSLGTSELSVEASGASSIELYLLNSTVAGKSGKGGTPQGPLDQIIDLGTFTLSGTGDLSFTAAAIPEPSTYAMILGVAALGFVMLRRRQVLA